jgi:hypothetical protein
LALSLAVKDAIEGFRGLWPWGTASPQDSVTVQGVFFDSERDDYDDATGLFNVSCDYLIWFEQG